MVLDPSAKAGAVHDCRAVAGLAEDSRTSDLRLGLLVLFAILIKMSSKP